MNLADLASEVRPDVPGCPDPVIEAALQKAAVRFFRDSGVWRETLSAISLTSGQATYTPSVPTESRLERVLRAKYGNSTLDQAPHEDLALRDESGAPRAFAMDPANDLVLYPTPDDNATEDVTVFALLVPLRSAITIPDRLGEEWEDALVAFAKADLLDTPKKPWADPQAAQYQRRIYQTERARAKQEALGGHGAVDRVKPQPFGA